MTDHRVQKNHPIRAVLVTVGLIVLTAVAAINASPGTHVYGARCTSISNPGFSEQFTCSFVRFSLGDPTLPGGFVFTGGFWLTLIVLAIPVSLFALYIRGLYKKAGLSD